MVNLLRLLLPALLPSWEFFKAVEPSPRIEWRLLAHPGDVSPSWQEFRPRPTQLPVLRMLCRLFWNPRWNEALYLVSLSERLMVAPTAFCADEISRRVMRDLLTAPPSQMGQPPYLQFRLLFVHRKGREIVQEVTYLSAAYPMPLAQP